MPRDILLPRTGKSGHYSASPSFWQSPVRCPGVARFNSGYSSCVSSQRLWISFLFFTCWTQILRSFLNLDILLLTPGIWQPLVRCLPCPGYTEKLDFLRDDFSQYFLRAPGMWQSLVQCLFSTCFARGIQENWNFLGDYLLRPLVYGSQLFGAGLPEECVRRFFWELTSGMVSVFSAIWVDTCVSLRVLLKEFLAFLRDGEPGSRGRFSRLGSHLEI